MRWAFFWLDPVSQIHFIFRIFACIGSWDVCLEWFSGDVSDSCRFIRKCLAQGISGIFHTRDTEPKWASGDDHIAGAVGLDRIWALSDGFAAANAMYSL